jgi:hypothetical protein
MKKLSMQTFNIRKLNYIEGKKQYQVKILIKFAALENLGDDE